MSRTKVSVGLATAIAALTAVLLAGAQTANLPKAGVNLKAPSASAPTSASPSASASPSVPAASTSNSTPPSATTEQRLAALEQKVAALQQENAELRQFITIHNGSLKITSGGSLTIKGAQGVSLQGTNLELYGTATAKLKGGSMTDIQGGLVRLNGGGKPAARMTDQVSTPPHGGVGTITKGSASVLIGE